MSEFTIDEFGHASYDSLGRLLGKSTYIDAGALYEIGGYDASALTTPTSTSHPGLFNAIGERISASTIVTGKQIGRAHV